MQGSIALDLVYQSGYLGLPFHRVFLNTGKDTIENLPSQRFKVPIGFRLNYFLGDNVIIRTYYCFYADSNMLGNAGIEACTDIESVGDELISDSLKLAIYRISQQQCTNIIKYAGAKSVTFCLHQEAEALHFVITDDGRGMEPGKLITGIGLRNIRGRLFLMRSNRAIDLFLVAHHGQGEVYGRDDLSQTLFFTGLIFVVV